MSKKAVFNWSGGKDSALALYKILQNPEYEIISLLTTINKEKQSSTMHNIPTKLLQEQAKSIGIPIYIVEIGSNAGMCAYNDAMQKAVNHFIAQGVKHFVFGDIFLHDVRSYREQQLSPYGIEVIEPLWDKTTKQIIEEFLESGLKTVITTTTASELDESYIGRILDRELINNLPKECDVCGENGEYHTFCFDGGMFSYPVKFTLEGSYKYCNTIKLDTGEEKEYCYWSAKLK